MYKVSNKHLSLSDFINRCSPKSTLGVTKEVEKNIRTGSSAIDEIIKKKKIVYGVNTGVGDLCDVVFDSDDLLKFQKNIILSHACGSAPYLDEKVARGVLFLVINSRGKGFSGVRDKTIKKLIAIFNNGISPLLPKQGSLGASGDLIPLAHLALMFLGKGEVYQNGKIVKASNVLKSLGFSSHTFQPKEALSLINGTDVTASQSAFLVEGARNLILSSTRVTAALFEILGASKLCLDEDLHKLKPHIGQIIVAKWLRDFLHGSKLCDRAHGKVQDSYVIRCAPQIDGSVLDQIEIGKKIIEIEINSVTDNPLFLKKGKEIKIVYGGNFHAQNAAFALDSLGIALTTLSKVMERRIERLLNTNLSGLPSFLVYNSGINSGLMIPHYLVAAIVAENNVLTHPASGYSLPVSANQEDFVSMSMTSANKADQILRNNEKILAIEMINIAQAMDISIREHKIPLSDFSPSARNLYKEIRLRSGIIKNDRLISKDIDILTKLIRDGHFVNI